MRTQTRNHNQNVFETRVETDACTQQGTKIQTCLTKEQEADACTQTRNRNPNVFETQCWKLMRVRRQGSTFHTCLKHRVETMLVNDKEPQSKRVWSKLC